MAAIPPDGGIRAWSIVAASFFIHVVVLGLVYGYGVLFTLLLAEFDGGRAATAAVGSVSVAMMMGGSFISGPLVQKRGCQFSLALGSLLIPLGLLLSSFTTALWQLFITFSVITGSGFALAYTPAVVIVGNYFSSRRSLATGIAVAGSGAGTVLVPVALTAFIAAFGWRGAFRLMALLSFIIMLVCTLACRPVPEGLAAERAAKLGLPQPKKQAMPKAARGAPRDSSLRALLRIPSYRTLLVGALFFNLGYQAPFSLIVQYALESGLDSAAAVALVVHLGIASTAGRIILGYLGDKLGSARMLAVSGFMIAFATLLLPPVKGAYFFVFCYVYGMFAGSLIALVPVVTASAVGLDRLPAAMGGLLGFQTVSALVGPPLAGIVADLAGQYDSSFILCGVLILLGSCPLTRVPALMKQEAAAEAAEVEADTKAIELTVVADDDGEGTDKADDGVVVTFMGSGKLLEERNDGMAVVQLAWATLYCPAAKL
eukprot:PLAT9028.1.p1 GENE.PLAT9028.1~~PLAT9028.1.p1  ORF type:complete len:496 (+),score=218.54 PLAT9028.1:31-1488(+)